MKILGVSCFYHDSAAALVQDGEIIAAAQEERFTRKKHDSNFPSKAVAYCLKEAGLKESDLDIVVFYEKPLIKFERLLETYIATAPFSLISFITAFSGWLKKKLWVEEEIQNNLPGFKGKILFTEHHESHAASAFYPSPFEEAAILTVDGVGEWATTTIAHGKGKNIKIIKELRFPHSLGLLYSAFTYYLGFKVNSGEYKVMGLAPYGEPKYTKIILDNIVDLKEDGSFRLNMKYFDYLSGFKMINNKFADLFGCPIRNPESDLGQVHMDIAASLQKVTDEIMLGLALQAKKVTGSRNLCMAGGVALNCVANSKILESGEFDNIWIQPAAGDAGGSLGAALAAWHLYLDGERVSKKHGDSQKGSLLGPAYKLEEIKAWLDKRQLPYKELDKDRNIHIAKLLTEGKVVGLFEGRMEFGPRALGSRSIIADPRNTEMQSVLNLKIKFRESFRPFAPSVLDEYKNEWFELDAESPYMLLTAGVKGDKLTPTNTQGKWGIELLKIPKSIIPAVTHIDNSARVQTVDKERNASYHSLISSFYEMTGCPVVVNTSFNVRGEPIVESPENAYQCFMRTDMDYLVLENLLLDKKNQPKLANDIDWKKEYELD